MMKSAVKKVRGDVHADCIDRQEHPGNGRDPVDGSVGATVSQHLGGIQFGEQVPQQRTDSATSSNEYQCVHELSGRQREVTWHLPYETTLYAW